MAALSSATIKKLQYALYLAGASGAIYGSYRVGTWISRRRKNNSSTVTTSGLVKSISADRSILKTTPPTASSRHSRSVPSPLSSARRSDSPGPGPAGKGSAVKRFFYWLVKKVQLHTGAPRYVAVLASAISIAMVASGIASEPLR
jgi:hypothetical protein